MTESSASDPETEPEPVMTRQEYLDSLKWKIGDVKQAPTQAKAPGKSKAEMIKRIIVGFMVLAWYVCPMFIHPIAVIVVTTNVIMIATREAFLLDSGSEPNQ